MALCALENKKPAVKLHVVTDSEQLYVGPKGKCGKWRRQGWVGSRGPLAHVDLWSMRWDRWQLCGDSVTMQWVLSHVGVRGNERADEGAVRGKRQAFVAVIRD